jgi:hypothetical protein
MAKNLLKKITSEDIKHICVNMTAAWFVGKVANTVSNAFFHYDLNKYNFIDHLIIGTGIGTIAYRKAGGGLKGVAVGLAAGTLFNVLWEPFENLYVWKAGEEWWKSVDTISDVAVVYAGGILSFLGERTKEYLSKKNKRD